MYLEFLQNRITRESSSEFWKCHLCQQSMKLKPLLEHIRSKVHKKKLNNIDKEQQKEELNKMLELDKKQRKKIVKNVISFDKRPIILNCHVCKCDIKGLSSSLAHINDPSHQQNLANFVEQNIQEKCIRLETQKVSCKDKIMNEVDTDIAAIVEASISDEQSRLYDVKNNEDTNSYYCNICKLEIIATPNISEHTQGSLHQAMESKLRGSTFSTNSNSIIYDESRNSYYCKICEYEIVSSPNVTQHIQGHQKMLETQKPADKSTVDISSQEFSKRTIIETQNTLQVEKVSNSCQTIVLQENNLGSCFIEVACCQICNVYLKDNSMAQCHVMLHLMKDLALLNEFDIIACEFSANEIYLKCLLCKYSCILNMSQAHEYMEKHFKTAIHLDRLQFFNYTLTDLGLEHVDKQIDNLDLNTLLRNPEIFPCVLCSICDVPLPLQKEQVQEHALGKGHKEKMRNKHNCQDIKKNGRFHIEDNNYYKCFMCNKAFCNILVLLDHYKTSEHKWKIEALKMIEKCFHTNFYLLNNAEVVRCSLCNTFLPNFVSVIDHISGTEHVENLKMSSTNLGSQKPLFQILNKVDYFSLNSKTLVKKNNKVTLTTTDKELYQLGFSAENIHLNTMLKPEVVINPLDDLVPLHFDNRLITRLPSLAKIKSPRTPKLNNQKNSFVANVLMNGKQYIKFCIDSGPENIYNLDSEKISLLKLGVSLTFSHHSDRVCFPCEQQFPNDVQSLFEHLQNQNHLKNIYDMQIDDQEFEDYPDQFSHLRLAKLYMRSLEQGIQCYACNVHIGDEDEIIRKHAEDLVHKEKSKLWEEQSEQLLNQYSIIYKDIWYYAEVFFCEICQKRCEFEIDFIKHLIHPDHMKKVYEHKFSKIDLKYDLCPSCITYWFGIANSYEIHCKSNFHKRFAKNKDFMVPKLTKTASEFLNEIDKNVDLLENESDKVKSKEESDNEIALLNAIIETVKPTYPTAKAYIFGSRLSHLGFPSSDVDVFLDCENVYYSSSTHKQCQQYINSVRSYFENTPNSWVVDEVLLASRVPIMKLRHIPTNLKCDISFINGLSVEKSKLVGIYNAAFPICRKLILFMKRWLTLCRLFGSDCITTFAISWCAIFYLQLQGILPTVHELIERKKESKILDGWECGFEELVTTENSNISFKERLKGFFNYFAKFDYQKNVICAYLGKTIDKHAFAYSDELPTEMDIYKNRLHNDEVDVFRYDSPLCIQDPIDLSQNMTKAVTKQQLRCFRQYCILSAEKC